MRNILLSLAALSLGACATVPHSAMSGIQSAGPGLFTVSEVTGFTNVAERAGAFCGSFGQRMHVEGDTTQNSLFSNERYAVLIFSCQDVPR